MSSTSTSPFGRGRSAAPRQPRRTLKDAAADEAAEIHTQHIRLREDFLRRDKRRNPTGWQLPPEAECGDHRGKVV